MTTDDRFGGINGLPYGDEESVSGLNLQLKSFAEIADSLHKKHQLDVGQSDLLTNYISSMQARLAARDLAELGARLGLSLKSPEVLTKIDQLVFPELPKLHYSQFFISSSAIPQIKSALDGAGFKLSFAMLEQSWRRFAGSTDSYEIVNGEIGEQDIQTVADVLTLAEESPETLEEAFRQLDRIEIHMLTGVVLTVVILVSILMPEVLSTLGLLGAYQSLLEIVKKLAS